MIGSRFSLLQSLRPFRQLLATRYRLGGHGLQDHSSWRRASDCRRILSVVLVVIGVLGSGVAFSQPVIPLNPDYELQVEDFVGIVQEEVATRVLLNFADGDSMQGLSFGVCHDPAFLTCLEIEAGTDLASYDNGIGPAFASFQVYPNGCTGGIVMDFLGFGPTPIDGYQLADVTYQCGDVPVVTSAGICAGLGAPPIDFLLQDVLNNAWIPTTVDAVVTIDVPIAPTEFIRGDGDGDGTFVALTDALFLLAFQFNQGPPPPCMEAADVDGNGVFVGLIDSLYILNYQFTGVTPAPPAPFPNCGLPVGPYDCETSGCP